MKHLTILVPEALASFNTFACIVGAYGMFNRANAFLEEKGKQPQFKVELAGVSEKSAINQGLMTIVPERTIESTRKTDLIIIPAISHDFRDPVMDNPPLVGWIKKQYKNGEEEASTCIGAWHMA